MNKQKYNTIACLLTALLLIALAGGCVGANLRTESGLAHNRIDGFEKDINKLIDTIISKHKVYSASTSPVAVMPGSLRTGTPFSRLEGLVMERLSVRLQEHHDVYDLSRDNWFEFREGRPLTRRNHASGLEGYFQNLTIYEVTVSADRILEQLKVSITASDANCRRLPGIVADISLDFDSDSPAYALYKSAPLSNPFPEGLEERPYATIDRLTFSLASELADAYGAGISAAGYPPADHEVRVLLYTKEPAGKDNLSYSIRDSLQQAIISNQGFTCVVSKEDFGPALDQIDFYEKNYHLFDVEEARFTAGTVLLMAETFRHTDGDKIGVALRAIWRVSPLETARGGLIAASVSGTYLSGFTAKAYLSLDKIRSREQPRYTGAAEGLELVSRNRSDIAPKRDFRGIDLCFCEVTEVLESRIYPVLKQAPGVAEIMRIDNSCDGRSGCLCYEVWYSGPQEELEAYLNRHLRTSNVRPFRLVSLGEDRLEIRFDGGFE